MNKIIIFIFVILSLLLGAVIINSENNICNQDYISLELRYNGEFSLVNKSLEKGCAPELNHIAGFRYSYNLTGDNKSLYSADFNPTLLYSDGFAEDIEGNVEEIQQDFFILLPSPKEAEKVELYDNNTKILEIPVYDVGAASCRI